MGSFFFWHGFSCCWRGVVAGGRDLSSPDRQGQGRGGGRLDEDADEAWLGLALRALRVCMWGFRWFFFGVLLVFGERRSRGGGMRGGEA